MAETAARLGDEMKALGSIPQVMAFSEVTPRRLGSPSARGVTFTHSRKEIQ